MQIGYVVRAKDMSPILMKPSRWIKSADYLISSERLKIIEALIGYLSFDGMSDGPIQFQN